jgi:hypothetical protein
MKTEYTKCNQGIFEAVSLFACRFTLIVLLHSTLLTAGCFQFFSTATFELFLPFHGPFTAPHGPEFFTAPNFFLRLLLSKGAVATATWQPWRHGKLQCLTMGFFLSDLGSTERPEWPECVDHVIQLLLVLWLIIRIYDHVPLLITNWYLYTILLVPTLFML